MLKQLAVTQRIVEDDHEVVPASTPVRSAADVIARLEVAEYEHGMGCDDDRYVTELIPTVRKLVVGRVNL
jgi:hypothetical protein